MVLLHVLQSTIFWKFGKLLLPVYKINDKKMISTQTAMDSIETQCGGPDIIYVYFERFTRRYALLN
jgi:hypothetical protein